MSEITQTVDLRLRLQNVVSALAEMAVENPDRGRYLLDLGVPILHAIDFLTELADHFDPAGAFFQLRGWQELEADLRQFRSGKQNGSGEAQ